MNDLPLKALRDKAILETVFGTDGLSQYLYNAYPVQSRKYKPGQIVYNTDSKYKHGKKFIFVSSVRWGNKNSSNWGGYLVIHCDGPKKGEFTTTTNIQTRKDYKEFVKRQKAPKSE